MLLASSAAVYAPPGYLVFSRMQVLMAQKWDAARMEVVGPTLPIADVFPDPGVTGEPRVSFSAGGAMAYSTQASLGRLEWFDRSGRSLGRVPMEPGPYERVVLSPDGRRAALVRFVSANDTDIWIADLYTGIASRFTHEKGLELVPAWSPDGTRLTFQSNRHGVWQIYSRATNGTEEEKRVRSAADIVSSSLSANASRSLSADGQRELRLIVEAGRHAGQTVIADWTMGLRR